MTYKTLFLITIGVFIFFQCEKKLEKKPTTIYTVNVKKIQAQKIQPSLELFGEIKAEGKHEHSFLIDGKLSTIKVKEGQNVKKGAILAQLDRSDYQEALKIAKAKLDEANDQLERLTKMYKAGSLAEADYNKIVFLQQQAQSNYTLYQNKLNYTTLRAAVSGTVSKIWVKNGGGISKGEPIIRVINNNSVLATVGIPENKVNGIDYNKNCNIIINATRDTLSGSITTLHPTASKLSRTFRLDILIDNKENKYREGMLCNVEVFETGSEEKISIPIQLVTKDIDGLNYVFVKRKDIAHKQRVFTGKISGNNIIIDKGLYTNDELILNPPINLMDGSAVKL
ncbi:efflux RND transporter periplasmic adaptor subunit [Flammeovirga sp. OC4]|uniref:efflux RND transporter periplasmic adaptor subunit n=1 Tax=Flammeovirga sp. OC4 TaxID=1382345 RepID=UPI0005C5041A|nr:efflux RND transporter periplasmic adaptor subunit [Flammeovirga sp. OC4]